MYYFHSHLWFHPQFQEKEKNWGPLAPSVGYLMTTIMQLKKGSYRIEYRVCVYNENTLLLSCLNDFQ
jgi:hypothetical protein